MPKQLRLTDAEFQAALQQIEAENDVWLQDFLQAKAARAAQARRETEIRVQVANAIGRYLEHAGGFIRQKTADARFLVSLQETTRGQEESPRHPRA